MRRLTHRQRVGAIALAAVAACFIALDAAGSGLAGAHGGVQGALGALYRGTDSVLGPARRFVAAVPHAWSNQDRVARLRKENAALRAQLTRAHDDRATAARLAKLQLAADHGGYRVLPARVTATGPGQGFDWTVTLDAGSGSGVAVGQTVTDGDGLVGRVIHVSGASCVVLLAADPGSGVGVRDERTGQLGLATGRGPDGFAVSPLDPAADLRPGDQLSTGPAGSSSYVGGLAVGTVTAVGKDANGATVASARPAVSPTALDLVGVILTGNPAPSADRAALAPAGGR